MADWGTAAVGLAGIGATLTATAIASYNATKERAHQRELARDDRHQTRIAAAYVDSLEIAERAGLWAQQVRPIMDSNPPRVPPPVPSLSEQTQAQVTLLAYGSREVVEAFETWRQCVHTIIRADQLIGLKLPRGEDGDEWLALENEYRPAERQARRRLADLMAVELGALNRTPTD